MKNAFEYEAELAALREELAVANHEIESRISAEVGAIEALNEAQQRLADAEQLKSGFFQQVTDEDLKAIADFVGDPELPTNSFFMRADAGNLANMTMHMVREVQSLRIGLADAERRNVELLKAVEQSIEWFETMSSGDGSGHADLAEAIRRMAAITKPEEAKP